MSRLETELKHLIVEVLNLEDVTPENIGSHDSLFVEGLGLDSIDALELGMAIKKKYGLTMGSDIKENQEHFANVASLARFIESKQVTPVRET